MGSINYEGQATQYKPNTILYSNELNSDFEPLYTAINGIIKALGSYYDNENPSISDDAVIQKTDNANTIAELLRNCLLNLLQKRDANGNIVSQIEINQVNYSGGTGIRLTYKYTPQGGQEMSNVITINNDGIKISVGSTNGGAINDFVVSPTANEVSLNGQNLIYSLASAEETSNEIKIKKLWYNNTTKTILFE